jgi:predicted dehydrogenase/threonine dehydrogenase-like Zn-dependent dehydrogenase
VKQVLQDARSGKLEVAEVPVPQVLPGCVLVRNACSLVSAGTERAVSDFASKGLAQKAAARPDLVRDLMNKVRRDGIVSAIQVARSRLDRPLALGYSSAGTVVAVAPDVHDIRPGDRVACAGAGYAVHGEFACVPRLLTAKFPETSPVSFDEAAFTTVGAVALHGIRTAEVKLGDTVAVIGLGLVGQLTAQLLKAAGCHVFGFDLAQDRSDLAVHLGADASSASRESFRAMCLQKSFNAGVDAVLITAETTSSDPVNFAAEIARDRAIIVAVGTVGMDIDRKLYYAKELEFRVSRSYGPGRYDAVYEQKGRDYPIGYVRWTETRNMEAFLHLLGDKKLNLEPLITHRFPIESARSAYDVITGRSNESSLAVLLTYPDYSDVSQVICSGAVARKKKTFSIGLSLIGAGNFATSTLLPAVKSLKNVSLRGVCSASGVHARHAARKFGFHYCTTSEQQILADSQSHALVIATRNHLHRQQVLAALKAGKHVFCEKPLCIGEDELADIVQARSLDAREAVVSVGFNRRFAPMALYLKQFFAEVSEPLSMTYRINAGKLPSDHWMNDPEQGGGRIVGELCHFVDLLMFISGSLPTQVYARALASDISYSGDNLSVLMEFASGSQATINYLANGDRAFSKERLEVFGGGHSAVLDDFRRVELVGNGRKKIIRSRWVQDKGHRGELQSFIQAIADGSANPIPFDEIVATTLTTFRIQDSLASGKPTDVDVAGFLSSILNTQTAGSVPA